MTDAPIREMPRQKYPKLVKPDRPQNTEFMLSWCRKWIPNFTYEEGRALASKAEPEKK